MNRRMMRFSFAVLAALVLAAPAARAQEYVPPAACPSGQAIIAYTPQSGIVCGLVGAPAPNLLINGTSEIDQANEGAAIASSAGALNAYCADGIRAQLSSTGGTPAAVTCQRVADAPAGYTDSVKVTVTAAASALNAGDYLLLTIPIEGGVLEDTALGGSGAQTLCRQWQVKTSIAGYTYGWALQNFAQTRSLPNAETVTNANTWTPFASCFAGDTGGTWVTSSPSGGAYLTIAIAAGSNYQATGAAWTGSNALGTSALTNTGPTTASFTFQITNWKLEISPSVTPFRRQAPAIELALAQRYYEKSYSPGTAIAAITAAGSSQWEGSTVSCCVGWSQPFKVTKRGSPAMTLYSPGTGSTGKAYDYVSSADYTAVVPTPGLGAFVLEVDSVPSATRFDPYVQWVADSRL
jgi:hypothetical protein